MRTTIPEVGSTVWIRGRTWRVTRAHGDRRITRLDVAALDMRQTFLLPFDRPVLERRSARTVRVRPQRGRATLAHALSTTYGVSTPGAAIDARITLWPYQLEPTLALVAGARRVLLADDVGLGKTIQAGLAIAELLRRRPDGRILVITPASLCGQWLTELTARFGIAAILTDRPTLASLDQDGLIGSNPWERPGVWLVSTDYLKQPHVFDNIPPQHWDLLVVDEAHAVAGRSDRHDTCAELARRSLQVLLLSATPHSGDDARFARLLDLGAHHDGGDDDLVVFRRTRTAVGLPGSRRMRWHRVGLDHDASALLERLTAFERMILRQARPARADAALLLLAVFRRRALSSFHALECSLTRRLDWLAQSDGSTSDGWQQTTFDFGDPDDMENEDDLSAITTDIGLPARHERTAIEALRSLVRRVASHDPKLRWIARAVSRTPEPVLIFTEFRDSLNAVLARLAGVRTTATLHGGQTRAERDADLRRFEEGSASVMVSTDAGGQGLNLQQACRWVINLELPWNPSRLEQRIGRVDRIGQRRRVHASLLVADHASEATLLLRLAERAVTANRAMDAGSAEWRPPSVLNLAASLIDGAAFTTTTPARAMPAATTRWRRRGCAAVKVCERRRRWRCRWRDTTMRRGRPERWRHRLRAESTSAEMVICAVPIVDAAGAVVERHVRVVRIEQGENAGGVQAVIPTAIAEQLHQALGPRLARARRLVALSGGAIVTAEIRVARHLESIARPGALQQDLFSRRHVRRRLLEEAAAAERQGADRARVALARRRLDLTFGPLEVLCVLEPR